MIEDLLRNNNIKVTRQRVEILKIINKLGFDSSIKNISNNVSDINQSTVYRILNKFYEDGLVEKVIGLNDEIIYVIIEEDKHFIRCLKCKKIEEVKTCALDHNIENVNGFIIKRHSLIIDGICKKCQSNI